MDESYLSAYIDKTGESTISLPGLEDISARLHVDLDSPGLGKLPGDDLLDEQLEVNDLIDFDFDVNGDIVPRRLPSPAHSQHDSPSRKRSSQLMHGDLSFQADSALKRAKTTTPTPVSQTHKVAVLTISYHMHIHRKDSSMVLSSSLVESKNRSRSSGS